MRLRLAVTFDIERKTKPETPGEYREVDMPGTVSEREGEMFVDSDPEPPGVGFRL